MDRNWYDSRGSMCNNCGTNYFDVRGFCSTCGSTDLKKCDYNREGVSGSLMCFANLVTDKSEYRDAWNNIQVWFQKLP